MTKYKFRGKSLKTGEWVYGSLLQINDDSYIYPYKTADLDDIDFGCGFVKVSKESVGQGLKDKNGMGLTEIYEGAIIDELRNVKGNIYEMDARKTDIIIPQLGTKAWNAAYKKAVDRGFDYSERYAYSSSFWKLDRIRKSLW